MQSVLDVDYPAVTFCNPAKYDTGEYMRAIFNNFAFSEAETTKKADYKSTNLRKTFKEFLGSLDGVSTVFVNKSK